MKILSSEAALVYVMAESGVRGFLTSGSIERNAPGTLDVFDADGRRFEYLSGKRLRSWCLVGLDGKPIADWKNIMPEDAGKITG